MNGMVCNIRYRNGRWFSSYNNGNRHTLPSIQTKGGEIVINKKEMREKIEQFREHIESLKKKVEMDLKILAILEKNYPKEEST